MPIQVLLVGDLHLGRRPVRLPPPEASEAGGKDWPAALSSRTAWERTVTLAIERGVDAVLLAGDVVENNQDRFQAFGPLERGVRRMREAGIEVLGVAGNHDDIALPRLARQIEGFRLLGEGGRFELAHVETRSGPLRVLGWSFPNRRHFENPLGTLAPDLQARVRSEPASEYGPVLGLLHTQLGGQGTGYAPTHATELATVGTDAWFLGHVHGPTLTAGPLSAGERPLGYLGSVAANDAGESGPHGPWLATLDGGRIRNLEHLVLAPLRFEPLELALSELPDPFENDEELENVVLAHLLESLEDLSQAVAEEQVDQPEALAVRLRITGAHPRHRDIADLLARLVGGGFSYHSNGILCYIEKLLDDGRSVLDIESLSRGTDPVAILARKLLAMEADEAETRRYAEAPGIAVRAGRQLLEELLDARARARTGAGGPA
ncbi:MAG TPA: DNA repair exonuclease [Planctomycetes bacterium]|nr:DNA repair exonuclease [Planctomycetota bacterium]